MKFIVDTHAFAWWLLGDRRLSQRSKQLLQDSGNQRLVSVASLWEISIKISTGRPNEFGHSLRNMVGELKFQGFGFLPIRLESLYVFERLPLLHRDPFDRLLVAEAIHSQLPILTSDRFIRQYSAETIW